MSSAYTPEDPAGPSRDRRIGDSLREEARGTRPAFSESLHNRIMDAVRTPTSDDAVSAPVPHPVRSLRFMPAIAAGLAMALCIWSGFESARIGRNATIAKPDTPLHVKTPLVGQADAFDAVVSLGLQLADADLGEWLGRSLDHQAQNVGRAVETHLQDRIMSWPLTTAPDNDQARTPTTAAERAGRRNSPLKWAHFAGLQIELQSHFPFISIDGVDR